MREEPEREPWPLCPRVEVLPMPEPIPRPMRFLFSFAFFGARRLERLRIAIVSSLNAGGLFGPATRMILWCRRDVGAKSPFLLMLNSLCLSPTLNPKLFDDADEMGNLCDHAADGWGVFALDDLVETSEAKALDDELVLDRGADLGTEVLQLDFGGCVVGCHWTRAPENLLSEELQLFDCLAAQGGDFGLVPKLDESVERGLDDIVRVRGAEALSKHVLHAGGG